MHFLFPSDPLHSRLPDELFIDQINVLTCAGFSTSLVVDSVLDGGGLEGIPMGAQVVYRGWMLRIDEYTRLIAAVGEAGGIPFITEHEYASAHHLPNWYSLIREFTPETRIFPANADLVNELQSLNWSAFFVKDFVKSLKTSVGSLIRDPKMITAVVDEMRKYRGEIEGGICIRRAEEFLPETEKRYFVVNKHPYGPDESKEAPAIVKVCSERIPSKFFSVDVAIRRDGVQRVVEVGDGQVSDLVGWTPEAFAQVWKGESM